MVGGSSKPLTLVSKIVNSLSLTAGKHYLKSCRSNSASSAYLHSVTGPRRHRALKLKKVLGGGGQVWGVVHPFRVQACPRKILETSRKNK